MQVLVDISKTQDEEIGDGTTSVAVLCGEMLREAEKLIEARIHPQTIVNGWRLACQEARRALEASAMDSGKDEAAFRKELMQARVSCCVGVLGRFAHSRCLADCDDDTLEQARLP